MAPRISREHLRLKLPTVAVASSSGRDRTVHVPAGVEITLLTRLDESDVPNRMVQIEWEGQRLKMFAIDIQERGENLSES